MALADCPSVKSPGLDGLLYMSYVTKPGFSWDYRLRFTPSGRNTRELLVLCALR